MNAIIVDDEPLAGDAIKNLLCKTDLDFSGYFNSPKAVLEFIKTNKVDLAFLDIQMPGMLGIDLAKQLPENTLLIFTTAYSEYAVDSYELDAIDYLVKPVEEKRFLRAVEKAKAYHEMITKAKNLSEEDLSPQVCAQHNSNFVLIKADRMFHKIFFKDILFIEGLKDYVIVHTDNKKLITRMNLKGILSLVPDDVFIRVSKSYVVNINHIDSFDNNDICIRRHEIAIGGNFREEFFKKMCVN